MIWKKLGFVNVSIFYRLSRQKEWLGTTGGFMNFIEPHILHPRPVVTGLIVGATGSFGKCFCF